MEIYFSGIDYNVARDFYERTGTKVSILLSFFEHGGEVLEEAELYKPYVEHLMLDSGAFSAYSMSPEESEILNLKFGSFLKGVDKQLLAETFTFVFSFDPIPDAEGFERNRNRYKELRLLYPNLTPVVHNVQPNSEEIDYYIDLNPHSIAIGKCKDKTNIRKVKPWADKINATPNVLFHFLGVMRQDVLDACYPDTCDATSVREYAEKGQCIYYPPNGAEKYDYLYFPNIRGRQKKNHAVIHDYAYKKEFYDEMKKTLNISFEDFHADTTKYLTLANILTYLKMAEKINKNHFNLVVQSETL